MPFPSRRATARSASPSRYPEYPYLAERGLSPETIEAFGLGYCSRGSMKGRVCVPLHNEHGELVAYLGRWALDEPIPENEDKYKLPVRRVGAIDECGR